MKIYGMGPKNPVGRSLRVNKGLGVADHSGDKVGFLGTIALTGAVRGGTSTTSLPPSRAGCHVCTRKTTGHSRSECSRRPVEAGWHAQPKGYRSPTREDTFQAVARDVDGGLRGRRKEVALGRLSTVS